MQDTIVFLEEGNRLLLWCPQCDMFVSWEVLIGRHLAMEMCTRGVDQNHMRLVEEEAHTSIEAAFWV